jgi:pyruvate dehydrogenase complex dehydrogenase (E1) component
MKGFGTNLIVAQRDFGPSALAISSEMEKRYHQIGIESFRRRKLIQSLRLTFDVLKEAYFVFALSLLLKGSLMLWSVLALTSV